MGSKEKRTKRNSTPFVMLTYKMLNSRAYQKLPASAAKALPLFLAKVKEHVNNDQRYREIFSLSYGELKKAAGLSDRTCAKVFRELVKFGFISPVTKGGLRGHGKTVSKYKLSLRWEEYGHPDFREVDLRRFGT